MKLFEYIMISKVGDQQEPKIIVPLKQGFAEDEDQMRLLVAREIPAEWINRLREVDIRVRPF